MSKSTANRIVECSAKYLGMVGVIEGDAEDADDPVMPSESDLKDVYAEYLNLLALASLYRKEAKVTDADFNKEDSEYEYNDTWLKIQKENYMKFRKRFTVKKVDTTEEKVSGAVSSKPVNHRQKEKRFQT